MSWDCYLMCIFLISASNPSHCMDLEENIDSTTPTITESVSGPIDVSTKNLVSEENNIGKIQKLVVVGVTQKSISLKWEPPASSEKQGNYSIYFKQSDTKDISTVGSLSNSYELEGLEPFTRYKIWVVSVVDGRQGQASEPIEAVTDVGQPSPPILVNASCYDSGQIFVEWERPLKFYKSVDLYQLYYKVVSDAIYKTINIQATSEEKNHSYILENLSGGKDYVIKACAGTKSLKDFDKTWLGEPSREKTVYLPKENCKPDYLSKSAAADSPTSVIAGTVTAILLVAIVVAFLCFKRRQKKHQQFVVEKFHATSVASTSELFKCDEKFGHDWNEEGVPVAQFADHVAKLHADSDAGFLREYSEIQSHSRKVQSAHLHSSKPENKTKNRYVNIVAYDHTRVRLANSEEDLCNDYINANFIDSYEKVNAYIGTQGPLEQTFEDFWRMVWEQNVFVIVMITNLTERKKKKCDLYWPKENLETYGSYEVTLLKVDHFASYTLRKMKLKSLKKKESHRDIVQFHFTSWPDHGVPAHPLPVLTFIRRSVEANPPGGGPIIVHCSAGVGRTGTFIAIDSMLQQARMKNEINVLGFLKHIRAQRNLLVQTEDQYIFINDALVEAIESGQTEVPREEIVEYCKKLSEPNADAQDNETLIEKQFTLATSYKLQEFLLQSSRCECNIKKNRDQSRIPTENYRVSLSSKPGLKGSDYINASWLHGHFQAKEFILTQHPLENEDFWRMVWEHNAQTIVLLSEIDDEDLKKFWPCASDDFNFDSFRVRFNEESSHAGIETIAFELLPNSDDFALSVCILYCPGWPGRNSVVADVTVLQNVVQSLRLGYQIGPVVVVDK